MKYLERDLSDAFEGRFFRFALLGEGGEGAVFAVWDRVQMKYVALKLARDTDLPGQAERFEREYQILATTRSPLLVTVFQHGWARVRDAGGCARNHSWYSMEKCESSVRRAFGSMTLGHRRDVVMQMLAGLSLLHAKNIAHRDIKPENLFLTEAAGRVQVKIGDFGLATVTRVAPNAVGGHVFGSPVYLAPERWKGDQSADWQPADQYAAGVTAFELLSGGVLPLDFSRGHRAGHEQGDVQPLRIPELPRRSFHEVDKVLARMLEKRPERRFQDIAQCKRELGAALAMEGLGG